MCVKEISVGLHLKFEERERERERERGGAREEREWNKRDGGCGVGGDGVFTERQCLVLVSLSILVSTTSKDHHVRESGQLFLPPLSTLCTLNVASCTPFFDYYYYYLI